MKEDDNYQMMLEANFLKHIGYEHVNAINEQLDQDIEDNVMYPVALDKWFDDYYHKDKMLNRKRYDQNQKYNKSIYLKRVAVVLFFVVGINLLLITNVEAFRLSLFNTFVNVTSNFTQVDFIRSDRQVKGDKVNLKEFSVEWEGDYYPTMIPSGYEISSINAYEHTQMIIFTNANQENIVFFQSSLQLGHMANTENGKVEKVMIGENEALYLYNDDISTMTMELSGYYIMVEAHTLNREEMIMIMENIKHK